MKLHLVCAKKSHWLYAQFINILTEPCYVSQLNLHIATIITSVAETVNIK